MNWENCIGICTNEAQSMSERSTQFQALVRKKTSRITWTHCILHRQALVSKYVSC